jgi:hypothetical protein
MNSYSAATPERGLIAQSDCKNSESRHKILRALQLLPKRHRSALTLLEVTDVRSDEFLSLAKLEVSTARSGRDRSWTINFANSLLNERWAHSGIDRATLTISRYTVSAYFVRGTTLLQLVG